MTTENCSTSRPLIRLHSIPVSWVGIIPCFARPCRHHHHHHRSLTIQIFSLRIVCALWHDISAQPAEYALFAHLAFIPGSRCPRSSSRPSATPPFVPGTCATLGGKSSTICRSNMFAHPATCRQLCCSLPSANAPSCWQPVSYRSLVCCRPYRAKELFLRSPPPNVFLPSCGNREGLRSVRNGVVKSVEKGVGMPRAGNVAGLDNIFHF